MRSRATVVLMAIVAFPGAGAPAPADATHWPEIGREQRPWAYNWWLGSAVDRENISKELRRYAEAGLGGVHVIPIYGTKGADERYLKYLSNEWLDMLRFAIGEAERQGIGLDLTTGSGWCFGGPDITPALGNFGAGVVATNIPVGGTYVGRADSVVAALAIDGRDAAGHLALSTNAAGVVEFRALKKPVRVLSLIARPTGRKVKRAAPGGEGLMLNPFSPESMRVYLEGFGSRFAAGGAPRVRAMYHDSYEYYHGAREFDAGWSNEVPGAFEKRRGYRLQDHLRELVGGADDEVSRRILADYRETLSDLMIEEVFPQWTRWCAAMGIRTRNQAHGSPANILDLYALADVPETEMFGRGERDPLRSGFDERLGEGDRDPMISKFASSAAHVMGRRLVSAETGTWLAEHFCETLEEMKCLVDLLLVSGVNHVIYHGCCYSPDDAPWPGWLFYAATQMNPRNPIWRDAVALNTYIGRCQAMLQSGEQDNDILLYWPIHDLWHTPAEKPGALDPIECGVHDRGWFDGQPIGKTARWLWGRGHCFDYASERQLQSARVAGADIAMPGGRYRAIVVPPTKYMPLALCEQLVDLARDGCTVVFEARLPSDVPGFSSFRERGEQLRQLLGGLAFQSSGLVRSAVVGKGKILVGDLGEALALAGIRRETLADVPGLRLIRRKHRDGQCYFVANQGTAVLDTWFEPARRAISADMMDPMTGEIHHAPSSAREGGGAFHLRLEPAQSMIIRTWDAVRSAPSPRAWQMPDPSGAVLAGPWSVAFMSGGPVLPAAYEARELRSWTDNGDPETEKFGGTALYTTRFDAVGPGPWILDLGEIKHSARIRINGIDQGIRFMAPYRMVVSGIKEKDNLLDVEVTNLAANRIRYMDANKIPWRVFKDANVVSIRYKPFDASTWPILPSGLLGPVRISTAIDAPLPGSIK